MAVGCRGGGGSDAGSDGEKEREKIGKEPENEGSDF